MTDDAWMVNDGKSYIDTREGWAKHMFLTATGKVWRVGEGRKVWGVGEGRKMWRVG
jgi:hypothetical protein